jgi:hypothetical protein
LLDDIEGDPDLEDEPIELDLSTRETVSQLFLDGEAEGTSRRREV